MIGITNRRVESADVVGAAMAEMTAEPDIGVDPGSEIYTCSNCAANWPYAAVRNTGRCPACGGGLRRADDRVQPPDT